MNRKIIFGFIIAIGFVAGFLFWSEYKDEDGLSVVDSFEKCVEESGAIMESYPRQCRTKGGQTFTENIGNEIEKSNLIRLSSPRPNDVVGSPLLVSGEARGYWFFEASFPVYLVDWDGKIIAEGIAQAKEEWMTEEFVPFEVVLEFTAPAIADTTDFGKRGSLILKKDNPSGLPEYDDALEIPIFFE